MTPRRKIVVVTGTRAEYGLLHPIMTAIKKDKNMELCIIATGIHLSYEFGHTVDYIESDGFKIDAKVDTLLSNDTQVSMAKSLGVGIIGIAQALETIDPDIVLVYGDRGEPFAAAVSAAHLMIPVAHVHGGDAARGSNIDDSIRYAITKFAHIHFTATKKHAERVIRLGEEPWRVHVVGSPALDAILHAKIPSSRDVAKIFSLDEEKQVILVIQHPTSISVQEAAREMRQTMEALRELELQSVVIYPNADAGGRAMIKVIKEYEKHPFIKAFKSVPRKEYLGLMRIASVMVGNSSSGIIEAPSLKLPVINIGIRQAGREKAENVIDVGHDKDEIVNSIKKTLCDDDFKEKVRKCKNPYGDGKSSERIVKILREIEITPRLLRKQITY